MPYSTSYSATGGAKKMAAFRYRKSTCYFHVVLGSSYPLLFVPTVGGPGPRAPELQGPRATNVQFLPRDAL